MPQLKPHRAKQKQKTPKYTYRSLKAHMVISVLTSISFPIFTVFLLILGVLIFASISKYYTFLISSHFSSVRFSLSVVSDSLRPHELQHARPPCPSPTPGVHSNSRPSSRWCHPAFSSSVIPFSSCPQSLLASQSFPMSSRVRLFVTLWIATHQASLSNEYSPLLIFWRCLCELCIVHIFWLSKTCIMV